MSRLANMSMQVASTAMPELPGLHTDFTPGLLSNVRTSACSRPPEPTTMTFMRTLFYNRVSPLFKDSFDNLNGFVHHTRVMHAISNVPCGQLLQGSAAECLIH